MFMNLLVASLIAGASLGAAATQEPAVDVLYLPTRFHLHVMAVERVTMLKLNRPEQLAVIDHDYRTGPDPQYRRAWEIVSDIEGYQPFIDELKALRKPRQ